MNNKIFGAADQVHVEVTLKFYEELLAKGNWDGSLKYLSNSLIVQEAEGLPYAGVYHGIPGLERLWGMLANYWDDMKVEAKNVTAGNGIVIGVLQFNATAKRTGKKVSMPIVEIVEFENNLISSMKPHYWDTKAMCDALGIS